MRDFTERARRPLSKEEAAENQAVVMQEAMERADREGFARAEAIYAATLREAVRQTLVLYHDGRKPKVADVVDLIERAFVRWSHNHRGRPGMTVRDVISEAIPDAVPERIAEALQGGPDDSFHRFTAEVAA